MKAGSSAANLSMSANSFSVPVPFNGGSTSNENLRLCVSLLMNVVMLISAYLVAKVRFFEEFFAGRAKKLCFFFDQMYIMELKGVKE